MNINRPQATMKRDLTSEKTKFNFQSATLYGIFRYFCKIRPSVNIDYINGLSNIKKLQKNGVWNNIRLTKSDTQD